jgi:Thioredoxin-like
MIPHEKEMVERLKNRPFALVGINSDGDRSVLRKILQENGITWRSAVDVSTHGPIAKQWNVHGWPTIYILDANGVIRYRGLRGQEMEQAVVGLLGELKARAGRP